MTPKAAFGSVCILTWTVFLPSILGFHLASISPCERQARTGSGAMTPRQSLFLPNQRMARDTQLKGIWGASSTSSSSSSSSDDDSTDDEETGKETEKTTMEEAEDGTSMTSTNALSDDVAEVESSIVGTEKSLLVLLNEIGNNFQVMAQRSTTKGYQSKGQYKKILHAAKACVYYSLFIIYRSYRGFFVLLPATFRQVYRKMEAAMNTGNLSLEEIGFTENDDNMRSSSSKWGTKVTVSILTSVVTISYIFGGILKMASKFLQTIAETSDVPKSFGAAADEVMDFEGRISRVGTDIGEENVETSGLAP